MEFLQSSFSGTEDISSKANKEEMIQIWEVYWAIF